MGENTTKENMEITKEISVPSFLATKTSRSNIVTPRRKRIQEQEQREKRKLKFISCDEIKGSWKTLKELDELIGLIVSNDTEPTKVDIRYNLITKSDNKSEKIRGIISI